MFTDYELTEATTSGAVFDRCEFLGAAFNASVHDTTRFDNCMFRDSSLFGATLRQCKLTGTRFQDTAMRSLTVEGGVWSWVSMFGADLLDKATLRGANLVKATLRAASIDGAVFTGADLSGVQLAGLDWRRTRVDGQLAMQIAESLGATIDAP